MKTFSELATIADSLKPAFDSLPLSDANLKSALNFFAETKYACESNDGLIYHAVDGDFNLRNLRDLCIAALNFAGNQELLKARFYSVWAQVNAIPYD